MTGELYLNQNEAFKCAYIPKQSHSGLCNILQADSAACARNATKLHIHARKSLTASDLRIYTAFEYGKYGWASDNSLPSSEATIADISRVTNTSAESVRRKRQQGLIIYLQHAIDRSWAYWTVGAGCERCPQTVALEFRLGLAATRTLSNVFQCPLFTVWMPIAEQKPTSLAVSAGSVVNLKMSSLL